MKKIKILYVIRTIAHLSYHVSTVKELCTNNCEVIILHDSEWSSKWSYKPLEEFIHEGLDVQVDLLIRRNDIWRKIIFPMRELRSYASYLNRKGQSDFYRQRWEGYLGKKIRSMVKRATIRRILVSSLAQLSYAIFEKFVPPDKEILSQILNLTPDVVVVSPANMRFSEEIEYIKAAKFLGIPTVIPVLSWDNVTTKGLFHIQPDLMLTWNESQLKEARDIHGIPNRVLRITGSPFLDKWHHILKPDSLRIDRRDFCQRLGLDSNRNFILYLGSSINIAKDESWIITQLSNRLKKSTDPLLCDLQILVRPHGANQEQYKKIVGDNIKVWFREFQLPDTQDVLAEYITSLKESVCVLGLNTTGMVDAILAESPVIAMILPEYKEKNTVKAIHFQYLINAKIYNIASSVDECFPYISSFLKGEDIQRSYRDQFINDYIWPCGQQRIAGDIQAKMICGLALPKTKGLEARGEDN
jgi:hypothetical protein